jgi:hypothetical protein
VCCLASQNIHLGRFTDAGCPGDQYHGTFTVVQVVEQGPK